MLLVSLGSGEQGIQAALALSSFFENIISSSANLGFHSCLLYFILWSSFLFYWRGQSRVISVSCRIIAWRRVELHMHCVGSAFPLVVPAAIFICDALLCTHWLCVSRYHGRPLGSLACSIRRDGLGNGNVLDLYDAYLGWYLFRDVWCATYNV